MQTRLHDTARRRLPPIRVAFWALVIANLLPELAFLGADWGLWGDRGLRYDAIANAGFWRGLLDNWQPNYPSQAVLMFLSYGFLHAGPWHLMVNLLVLFILGPPIAARYGALRFLALYLAGIIGGGLAFATLSNSAAPMVGASGALFALAGAFLGRDYVRRANHDRPVWPVLRVILALIVLNAILWWIMAGRLGWEAHLGGFLAGWLFAMTVPPQKWRRA